MCKADTINDTTAPATAMAQLNNLLSLSTAINIAEISIGITIK
jgi:hypothetical protein